MEINSDIAKEYLGVHAQYKEKYGDRIVVLYQIGDFYELYGDENFMYKICYETLDIQFRKIPTETVLYTGGFPMKAVNKYTKLLLHREYLVVICNQEDSPTKKGKKIRVVSEIQSKATSTDDDILGSDSQLLMSIFLEYDENKLSETSICYIDISTGKITCITDGISSYPEIIRILKKLNPKQILLNTDECPLSKEALIETLQIRDRLTHVYINKVDKALKKPAFANTFLSTFYRKRMVTHIEYLGLEKYPSLIVSFILMLGCILEFNKSVIAKLNRPLLESYKGHLILSENAITQLHLLNDAGNPGLFSIIDRTVTPGGKRILKKMLLNPITDTAELTERYDTIEKMCPVFPIYRTHLSRIKDLERLHRKITLGTLQPGEFYYLNESYLSIVELIKICESDKICRNYIPEVTKNQFYNLIHEYRGILIPENLKDLNFKSDITVPLFRTGIYADLDKVWSEHNLAKAELTAISVNLGKYMNEDPIKIDYSISYGWFLIAPKSKKKFLSNLNLEFKETQGQLKIFNSQITELSDIIINTTAEIKKLSEKYFIEYLGKISSTYLEVLELISTFSNYLDVVASIAYVSVSNKYCKPQIIEREKAYVTATGARHPIIEKNIAVKYVQNDINLGVEVDGMLLYGTNSGGKSSYGRSVGINLILAQAGFYVACDSFIYKPYKNIITKIAITDNIHRGKSTFMSEMLILSDIIENSTENTMIITDELSSGSEFSSAVAISATAILEFSLKKSSFIFITHIHQLAEIPEITELKNIRTYYLNVIIKEKSNDVIFDRTLIQGKPPSKYGIEIASHLGLNPTFINTAYAIRNRYDGINNKIGTKTSNYNSNLYMDECKICHTKPTDELPLDTHHITGQCQFKKDNEYNFNKDDIFNLVPLCKKCHLDVHHKKYVII
jgi:DNA mismatch repair protein MutS